MKRLLFIVAFALHLALAPLQASAWPKASSVAECTWLWDLALTARGAAMQGIARETTRGMIWRIFVTPPEDQDGRTLGNAIVDAAYSTPWKDDEHAGDFPLRLRAACLLNGDMDAVLGVGL